MSSTDDSTTEVDVASNQSIGQMLLVAREKKALSAIDLADKLNLGVAVIEQLEQEDFESLPAPAFVRGYIRAMAIELDLDATEVLAIYAQQSTVNDPSLGSTSAAVKQKASNDPLMIWGSVMILLVILALLAIWLMGLGSPEQALTDTQVEDGQNVELPTNDEMLLPELQQVVDSLDILTPEAIEEPTTAEISEAVEQNTPASVNTQSPVGEDVLKVSVLGTSWADVSDSTGFKLIYGLLDKQDQTLTLKGKAPFSVFLGDATQIGLVFNGEAFDFSDSVRTNNVAKFYVK